MAVLSENGRHRRPHRIPRALAAVLLVVLLTATPADPSRTTAAAVPAAYAAIEER
ncbi:MAG: hypothetical protein HOY79_23820 [Streptomyces sp.]|nr:hypothetical protein [Streptomyces sp.]